MTVEGTTIQVVEKPQEKIGIDMTSGHIHSYISMTTVLELVGAAVKRYLVIYRHFHVLAQVGFHLIFEKNDDFNKTN